MWGLRPHTHALKPPASGRINVGAPPPNPCPKASGSREDNRFQAFFPPSNYGQQFPSLPSHLLIMDNSFQALPPTSVVAVDTGPATQGPNGLVAVEARDPGPQWTRPRRGPGPRVPGPVAVQARDPWS